MRSFSIIFLMLLFSYVSQGQSKLEKTLKLYNSESVPYIYTEELASMENIILLDTRKKNEYTVSHLKNAIWVGYDSFNKKAVSSKVTDKKTPIVVYCSIGVRSENIGELLLEMGYTNVKNLYGGIFEWKNKDQPVFNMENTETENVHAYDKQWGKLLKKGKKIYK
ncbi:rhodanese-like domain-containing protein [uncultured Maribacter sp.]|uniref:rhodanese-like domain-containing protein n=1 Tax=uncultured Maribacter sp. TaxID=431308 RepID=UPI002634753C|nr:rhodanese-like domain-containing protein [uncultured Maribacter sp.]